MFNGFHSNAVILLLALRGKTDCLLYLILPKGLKHTGGQVYITLFYQTVEPYLQKRGGGSTSFICSNQFNVERNRRCRGSY